MGNKIFVFLLILSVLSFIGCLASNQTSLKQDVVEQNKTEQLITKEVKPTYKYVTEKPMGWFKNGQEADIILYATEFNESSPLVLNHPGKVATEGKRLIVSDTWNNRVLIWNEIPTRDNQLPDLVLGQPDFNSNIGRLGRDGMNWPMGIATDGNKLVIGDANNDRVLIWNQFPTKNGQPADLVLGVSDFDSWPNNWNVECKRDPTTRIYWPWDMWTDGNKLIVGSTGSRGALVWNTFPTKDNQPADIVIGAEDFSTRFADTSNPLVGIPGARSIASDGNRLVLGSYHPHQAYFFKKFPTKSGQAADFVIPFPDWGVMGLDMKDDKLFVASAHNIYIWNSFPESSDKKFDIKLGVEMVREEYLKSVDKKLFYPNKFDFPYDVASNGEKLMVADTGNNRILIFNKIPTEQDAKADVVIGIPDIFVSRNSFSSSPIPFSDGKKLIVGVDGFGVWIYNNLPDENKAEADVVVGKLLGQTIVGGQAITDGKRLIMVHREGSSIFIWNEIPTKDNQLPDIILGAVITLDNWGRRGSGKTGLNNPTAITSDGKRLFVVDQGNNRVLIWNEMPIQNQTPADIVLGQTDFDSTLPGNSLSKFDHPNSISTDGKRLVLTDDNNRILVWKTIPTTNGQVADFEIKIIDHTAEINCAGIPQYARISFAAGVYVHNNKLFLADIANNRVLGWNKFPDSEMDEPDIVLGQKDFLSNYPSNSKTGLFSPAYISFDGSFLWVGETKWSNGLLRFSVQPVE